MAAPSVASPAPRVPACHQPAGLNAAHSGANNGLLQNESLEGLEL